MSNPLLGMAIRTMLACTSRRQALANAEQMLQRYLAVGRDLTEAMGRRTVEVPRMPGVDEDMRRWSYFQLLEHNAIVNRSITALVQQLACGEALSGAALINPKRDVLPTGDSGPEQREAFGQSVRDHIETVRRLGPLRGTATKRHPLFGDFDAHQWNGMFALHLKIHLAQLKRICDGARQAGGG